MWYGYINLYRTGLLRDIGVVHVEEHNDSPENSKFAEMMKSKAVQLIAFFILVYVGVEGK